jgi:hypothetical protein
MPRRLTLCVDSLAEQGERVRVLPIDHCLQPTILLN